MADAIRDLIDARAALAPPADDLYKKRAPWLDAAPVALKSEAEIAEAIRKKWDETEEWDYNKLPALAASVVIALHKGEK